MKSWRFPLLVASLAGCGPGGDGDVFSCSCQTAYLDTTNQTIYQEEVIPISLCEASFATDHTPDAEAECVMVADATDTDNTNHQCTCSCIHLVERCDTP